MMCDFGIERIDENELNNAGGRFFAIPLLVFCLSFFFSTRFFFGLS